MTEPLAQGRIPVLDVAIPQAGKQCRLFFDTGAQVSYLDEGIARHFPACGSVEDFYPGIGQFITQQVNLSIQMKFLV